MSGKVNPPHFFEGFWVTKSDGEVKLLGSRCPGCGELFFPARSDDHCIHCQRDGLNKVELGPWGRIMTFTCVMQHPAGGYYHGPLPFNFGLIDLEDGVRVEAHIGGDFHKLKVGMRVKLAVESFYTDEEGNEIQMFQFQPVEN